MFQEKPWPKSGYTGLEAVLEILQVVYQFTGNYLYSPWTFVGGIIGSLLELLMELFQLLGVYGMSGEVELSDRDEDLAGLPEDFDSDSGHCNAGVVEALV